jgi:hypothetical protein
MDLFCPVGLEFELLHDSVGKSVQFKASGDDGRDPPAEAQTRPEARRNHLAPIHSRRIYYRLTALGQTTLRAETERLSRVTRVARRQLGSA